jgi:chemotaxis-related protein WspD
MDRTSDGTAPLPLLRLNDCWNRIGIRGDGSCPELQQHVHCRNCPTYMAAAAILLDRAIPDGEAAIWRSESAGPERLPVGGAESILIFRIGAEWLGLQSTLIKEIAEERKIHRLPHQRNDAVLGIVNIRGALVLCMSLARLLKVGEDAGEEQVRNRNLFKPMLVTTHGEHTVVFPVDEVDGVHRFSQSALVAAPSTVGHTSAVYTKGVLPWRDRTVGVLDSDLLFYTLNRSIA